VQPLVISAVTLLSPTAALAEVCDKYFDTWPDFPQRVVDHELAFGLSTLGIVAAFLWLAARFVPAKLNLAIAAFGLMASGFILDVVILDEFVQHEVWIAAVREGCKSGYATGTATFTLIFVMFAGAALVAIRRISWSRRMPPQA